jgi:peptidoglycan/LPS O-acetylase OafA/YrhL
MRHMVQLDGLRAMAVLAVIFSHAGPAAIAHQIGAGALGVRLFFVLSGFLITGILLRARYETAAPGVALRAFYARRFLRIFPLYYGVLFAIAALGLPEARDAFWWHVSYASNYYYALQGQWGSALSHFWSLAVEEQFYLVWPWLVLFTPLRRLPFVLIGTILLGPVSRVILLHTTDNLISAATPTIACLDSLGAGALLAWLWYAPGPAHAASRPAATRMTGIALVCGLACLAIVTLFGTLGTGWKIRLALWDLGASLVFVWLVNGAARGFSGAAGRLLSSRPLVYLGTISYGIYIFHPLVEPAIKGLGAWSGLDLPFPERGGAARFVCVAAPAILMAALSWHAFERPINALKSRFSYAGDPRDPLP